MNKLLTIVQCGFSDVVTMFYNPVKALENEQRKVEKKYWNAGRAYQKASGDLEVLRGNLRDLQRTLERAHSRLDACSEDAEKELQCAQNIVLLQRQHVEVQNILQDNELSLAAANKALNVMELRIQRNENKLSNLKLKQEMNKTARVMLDMLQIDKNKIGEVSFDSVEKLLVDDQRRIDGERKSIQCRSEVEDTSIESEALQLIEGRKLLLLERKF